MTTPPARVMVVDGGQGDSELAAAFGRDGFEVRVVGASDAGVAAADFVPDVLVIDLRQADPVLTVREVTRLIVADPGALDATSATRRLLVEMAGDEPVLQAQDLVIDLRRQLAVYGGQPLHLTQTELVLLAMLVRQHGSVVSKSRLLNLVWGPDATNVNVIEVHISSLRRKLERVGPRLVHTVRGVGYVFEPRPRR